MKVQRVARELGLRIVMSLATLPALPALAVDLTTAWQAALMADPTLASAIANRDAAAENIAIARARLLPQVSLQSTTQHLEQTTVQGGLSSDFSGRSSSTQLALRQGVYRPRDWRGVDIARSQAELGASKLLAAQSDLWNRTAVAWVEVLTAQALRDLFTRTLEAARVQAEQEERRFRGGEGTRDAVAETAAQRSAVRARLTESGLELQAKVQAFNLLTRLGVAGLEDDRLPTVAALDLIPEPEQGLLDRILAVNPELAAARANEALSERRLAQASADHLPTLDVVGAVNRAENDSTNTLGTRYRNVQLGVQLVIPIFSGGGVSASQRQAAAAYVAATADRDAVAQRLRLQFGSDWRAQAGLRERAMGAMELVQAALEQRRAVELSVKKGFKTWADVGTVNQLLARRESDVVDAIGLLLKTQARLLSLLPTADPAWSRWALGLANPMN